MRKGARALQRLGRALLWAMVFVAVTGLTGCAAPSATPQGWGGSGAGAKAPSPATPWVRYHNRYFGFSIEVPAHWYRVESVFLQAYDKSKAGFISGNGADLGADIARLHPRGIMLIAASRYPVSHSGGRFNDNLICTAIKISDVPGITTGEDYLRYATHRHDRLATPIKSILIHAHPFYVQAMREESHQNITQQIVATILKGYALNCLLTFRTGTRPEVMFRSIASLHIKE